MVSCKGIPTGITTLVPDRKPILSLRNNRLQVIMGKEDFANLIWIAYYLDDLKESEQN